VIRETVQERVQRNNKKRSSGERASASPLDVNR